METKLLSHYKETNAARLGTNNVPARDGRRGGIPAHGRLSSRSELGCPLVRCPRKNALHSSGVASQLRWPGSIILAAHFCIENRLGIPSPRADYVREAEKCVKSHQRWNFTVSSGASETAIETRIGQRAEFQVTLSCSKTDLILAKLNFQFRLLFIASV